MLLPETVFTTIPARIVDISGTCHILSRRKYLIHKHHPADQAEDIVVVEEVSEEEDRSAVVPEEDGNK